MKSGNHTLCVQSRQCLQKKPTCSLLFYTIHAFFYRRYAWRRQGTSKGKMPFLGYGSFMLLLRDLDLSIPTLQSFSLLLVKLLQIECSKDGNQFCRFCSWNSNLDTCKCAKSSGHTYLKVGNQNNEVKFSSCFFKMGISGTTLSHRNTLQM